MFKHPWLPRIKTQHWTHISYDFNKNGYYLNSGRIIKCHEEGTEEKGLNTLVWEHILAQLLWIFCKKMEILQKQKKTFKM